MGKIDKLGRGLALAGALMAAEPALAEDKPTAPVELASATSQQVDCKLLARNHKGTGKEKLKLYSDCRNGVLDARIADKNALITEQEARIAEQERIIAALRKEVRKLGLEIDEDYRILDADGRELARIVSINGQFIVRRQQGEDRVEIAEKRTAQALDRIERYLLENS